MTDQITRHDETFRPRARLVSILGEHLISDQAVGLIELVKNSYDADATTVNIDVRGINEPKTTVVTIADNGTGMTVKDIRDKWLSPAVDHKERDKQKNIRTPFGRLPIGEKGVGRFAVHQLGHRLELVTRASGQPEVLVSLDWDKFDEDAYLDNVQVEVVERPPQVFSGDLTGTSMTVTGARNPWTPKLLKKVHRTLRRLQSPILEEDQRFRINLSCPEHPELESIYPTDILPKAHYEFRVLVQDTGRCDIEYLCRHPSPSVPEREIPESDVNLVALAGDELQADKPRCGPFWLNLYVWDRSKDFLQAAEVSRKELDALCGVSLFRDGLRILPYGEPGDDWLLLDQERIQDPSERIGNNQVIGVIQFDQSNNLQLRDKTNREGLIENDAFLDLHALVRAAIRYFLKFWKNDRPPTKQPSRGDRTGTVAGARAVATALKETARDDVEVAVPETALTSSGKDHGNSSLSINEASPAQIVSQRQAIELLIQHIDGTDQSIKERDRRLDLLLQLASTGLAAERIVHEFGRQVVTASKSIEVLRELVAREKSAQVEVDVIQASLDTLQNEFRVLAPYEMRRRNERTRPVNVHEIATLALKLNSDAISQYQIDSNVTGDDWYVKARPTPLLQILDNLTHNACTWIPTLPDGSPRKLAIILLQEKNSILVADTGPGIDIETAPSIFDPFFSMKAGGKGLGLFISAELATKQGALLRLALDQERRLAPSWATGAIFIVEFLSDVSVTR